MDLEHIWLSGHDQRDFDFANKYNLKIKTVVSQKMKMMILRLQRSLFRTWKNYKF